MVVNSTTTNRRCWRVEPTFQNAFSKHSSTFASRKITLKCWFGLPKSSFEEHAFVAKCIYSIFAWKHTLIRIPNRFPAMADSVAAVDSKEIAAVGIGYLSRC